MNELRRFAIAVLAAANGVFFPGAVGTLAAQPRLQYQPPPYFCCGGSGVPDVWVASDIGGGTLSIYPFAPFTGSFRDAFTRTLFSDRIPFEQREARIVRRPAGDTAAVTGAEAAMALGFSALDAQGRLIEHVRVAILAAGQVALVDFAVQTDRASNTTRTQQGFLAFLKALSVANEAPTAASAGPFGAVPPSGRDRAAPDAPPAVGTAIHTLRYQKPPFFCCDGSGNPDVWIASIAPGDEGIISIYQFEPFAGNLRDVFLRTRFADRIAVDKREADLASQPTVSNTTIPGAEQAIVMQFAGRDGYGRIIQHVRLALSSGNVAAIVDFQSSNWQTSIRSRQAFGEFLKTLMVVSETRRSAGFAR